MAFTLFKKKEEKQPSASIQSSPQIPEPPAASDASQIPQFQTGSRPQQLDEDYEALFRKYYPSSEEQDQLAAQQNSPPAQFGSLQQLPEQPAFGTQPSDPFMPQMKPKPMSNPQLNPQPSIVQQGQTPYQPEQQPEQIPSDIKMELDTSKPIFLRVDRYKVILRELSNVKAMIRNANSSLQALKALKENEDVELQNWHSRIEDIERKLIYVDDELFGNQ